MDRRRLASFDFGLAFAVAALVSIAAALFALGDRGFAQLAYLRPAIAAGQVWRLFTAHLLHLNAAHWWMNVAALVLIAGLFAPVLSARVFLAVVVIAAGAIGAALWYGSADVEWYVGLSGVLHALFAFAAFRWWQRQRSASALFVILLLFKLVWETRLPAFADGIGVPVVYAAHRYGAITGISLALLSAAYAAIMRRLIKARAPDRNRGATDR